MRSDLENTLPYVGGTIWTSVLTHATGWTRGLLKTVVPINLSVDPWMPVQYHWNSVPVLLAVLMGLLIAWLFLRSLRQNRLVAFGLSWFLIALLPTSGVIPIVNIYADRYFYMPLLGLAMALGGWLSKCELSTYRRWRPFLVLAVGLMALLTTGRVRVFADDPTLWGDALAKLGKRPWPLSAMVAQGDPPLIFLQKKLASDPNNTMPWTRLAAAHMVREEFEDAAEGLLKAIAIDPVNAEFHVMLADTYTQMERFDQAVEHYQRAIALKPQLAEAHNNLGVLFLEQGKREEAKEQFLRALLPQPDFPDAMSNLATVYGLEGDTAKAQQLWEAVLQLDAYHASARWNLQRLRNKRSR
jgi:tetratricopeptide (TPR) repeat protein